jgi:hypothetical protein
VKAWLSRAGYSFTARDVDEDHEAYGELIALGFRSVPVTVIAGRAVKGFDEAQLRAALDAAGQP